MQTNRYDRNKQKAIAKSQQPKTRGPKTPYKREKYKLD